MYEITVIENHLNDNALIIAHIPCNDDDVEYVARDLITQEDRAVASGLIVAYSTLTKYYPNRDATLHYTPQYVMTVKP
jgi:hypothetical protein